MMIAPRDEADGPLPAILLALTVVSGIVDASYLLLGHVFVANMTGNVLVLGFALGGPAGSRRSPSCSPWPPSGARRGSGPPH